MLKRRDTSWIETLGEPSDAAAWRLAPAAAVFALAWLVLGWPWLSGRVTIPWDAKAEFLPQIQFLAQSLARGDSPFWNPFIFSGHPQIADPQSQIFQPPFLLMALLTGDPSLRAVDTTVLASILAGGVALMLFVRDKGWHWAGAILTALVFGFGAAMAWRIQHTGQVLSLVYLAFALLFLDRALQRGTLAYGLAAGVTGALLVLGRDQVALLAIYILIGYVVWHVVTADEPLEAVRTSAPPLVLCGLAGIALVVLPILMTTLLSAGSNRPEIDFIGAGRGSLHPALSLTLFAPDLFGSSGEMANYWGPPSFTWRDTDLFIAQNVGQLYIGAVPLLLVMLGLAMGLLWDREIRFFTIALVLVSLYALGWYTPVFEPMHRFLPGVDLFRRPADAVFEIGFLLALLAGYVAHRLMSFRLPPLRPAHVLMVEAVVVAAFVYGAYLAFHFDRWERAAFPFWVAAAIFALASAVLAAAIWNQPHRPRLAASLLIAFTVADLAYSNGPGGATALPPDTYDVLRPDTRNETITALKAKVAETRDATRRYRVELAGLGFHWPNASETHRLENTLGYNPVRLGLYTRASGAEDHVGMPGDRKFSKLMPGYRSLLSDLLGLRFIATGAPVEEIDKRLKPGDLALVQKTADGFVYENATALPRVLFATGAQRADFAAILADGQWPAFDPAATVLLESEAPQMPPARPGSVKILSYANTAVRLEVDSPDGGWAVLNDVWHPWWRVTVDGVAAPMLKANVLFRAVRVPAGRHEVRFEFAPVSGAIAELLAARIR